MLIRYWARATDSAFPVMVMVRSRLAGASRSSQLEILIIAPLICLIKQLSVFSIIETGFVSLKYDVDITGGQPDINNSAETL